MSEDMSHQALAVMSVLLLGVFLFGALVMSVEYAAQTGLLSHEVSSACPEQCVDGRWGVLCKVSPSLVGKSGVCMGKMIVQKNIEYCSCDRD